MNSILSVIIVSVCVFGGYAYSGGEFHVFFHLGEWIVIVGAAFGAMVGYAPIPTFKRVLKTVPKAFKGSGINAETYYQLMGLLFTIFNVIRKEGVLGIEKDLSDPHNSPRFQKFPAISHNHHAMDLLVGSLRLFVDGVVNAFDLDKLMETEIDTHHAEEAIVPGMLNKTADAFPGIGIVAAVLGIIITMQYIDGPPSEIGAKVAVALGGTFVGILFCYGYIQPLAASIEAMNHENHVLLNSIRAGVVAFAGGAPPQVALEFARKAIESGFRPTNEQMDQLQQELRKG